jgi:hypothetical protein
MLYPDTPPSEKPFTGTLLFAVLVGAVVGVLAA